MFPIFCDELPDEKTWRTNNEKSSWRSAKEDKENLSNIEKNSWRTSKDENCAPVAASSRPLQRNKVILQFGGKIIEIARIVDHHFHLILKLLLFQATACLPSLVDKENREPLAVRLKESRRDPEKVAKDPGKVQLSQREPSREESKAPRILRRYMVDIIGIDVISIFLQEGL